MGKADGRNRQGGAYPKAWYTLRPCSCACMPVHVSSRMLHLGSTLLLSWSPWCPGHCDAWPCCAAGGQLGGTQPGCSSTQRAEQPGRGARCHQVGWLESPLCAAGAGILEGEQQRAHDQLLMFVATGKHAATRSQPSCSVAPPLQAPAEAARRWRACRLSNGPHQVGGAAWSLAG